MSDKSLQPSGGPGRPKDPAKRLAILEAAKQLFMQNGYEGSSMDAIAAEAGVSKLTVYSHFTDKETLFACAVESKCEEQLPPLFFELGPNSSIEQALLAIGRGFNALVNSEESLAMHRLMVAQAAQNPQLSQLFFNAGPQRVIDAMRHLLEQASAKGQLSIDNPQHAAEHFFCLIKGGCHFRLMIGVLPPPDAQEADEHVQEVVRLFVRAYRP
ncbi:TetR/AcrR family transcriptional regulator [Pseudomonas sp. Gutcm_11s]|uniref:TetR/AcrR family transcriptional regulator n=1 Tax=Pseudomonas sp. Gutcm_11s TaxID=3026088 RepID=UPI00235EFE45|nr:TetR/AcrR family transcriptional regulator [Pseudomonas sp. Gutcm_11s]MDD0841868.1 TetR/AcrR family transcriptional regulator [Pseudomonas sp. Gutcm_11s]